MMQVCYLIQNHNCLLGSIINFLPFILALSSVQLHFKSSLCIQRIHDGISINHDANTTHVNHLNRNNFIKKEEKNKTPTSLKSSLFFSCYAYAFMRASWWLTCRCPLCCIYISCWFVCSQSLKFLFCPILSRYVKMETNNCPVGVRGFKSHPPHHSELIEFLASIHARIHPILSSQTVFVQSTRNIHKQKILYETILLNDLNTNK